MNTMKYLCFMVYTFLSIAQAREVDMGASGDTCIPMTLKNMKEETPLFQQTQNFSQVLQKQVDDLSYQPFLDNVGEENVKALMATNADPDKLYQLLMDKNLHQDPSFYTTFIEAQMFKNNKIIWAQSLLKLLNFTVNWENIGEKHPELEIFKLEQKDVNNLLHFINHYRYSPLFSWRDGGKLLTEIAFKHDVLLDGDLSLKSIFQSYVCDPISWGIPTAGGIGGMIPVFMYINNDLMFHSIGLASFLGTMGGAACWIGLQYCIHGSVYENLYAFYWPNVHRKHEVIDQLQKQLYSISGHD